MKFWFLTKLGYLDADRANLATDSLFYFLNLTLSWHSPCFIMPFKTLDSGYFIVAHFYWIASCNHLRRMFCMPFWRVWGSIYLVLGLIWLWFLPWFFYFNEEGECYIMLWQCWWSFLQDVLLIPHPFIPVCSCVRFFFYLYTSQCTLLRGCDFILYFMVSRFQSSELLLALIFNIFFVQYIVTIVFNRKVRQRNISFCSFQISHLGRRHLGFY